MTQISKPNYHAGLAISRAQAQAIAEKNAALATKDAEIARLREALEFYADRDMEGYDVDVTSYGLSMTKGKIILDEGDTARSALSPIPDPAGGMPVEVKP